MPLNPLAYNDQYFTDIYKRGDPLSAFAFDKQFNLIANYINKQMIPHINALSASNLVGSTTPVNIGKFYKNVGDGTTEFTDIINSSFVDYSISWDKLQTATPGSILVSNVASQFEAVAPSAPHQVLVAVNNDKPVWKLLTSENIKNRSIHGSKVALGSIPQSKVYPGTLRTQLTNSAITTPKIKDRAVTTPKIADEAFTALVLGNDLTFTLLNTLSTQRIPDNYITYDMLHHYDFKGFDDFNTNMNEPAFDASEKIPNIKFDYSNSGFKFDTNPILAPKLITANKIRRNSINARRLLYTDQYGVQKPYPRDIIADGAITLEMLPLSWQRLIRR